MRLPLSLKKYFWNVEFSELSPTDDATVIAERLLEFGNPAAIRWLLNNIPQYVVREVIKRRRALSPRSRFFWAAYFHIPRSQIPCLKKSFLQRRKALWLYEKEKNSSWERRQKPPSFSFAHKPFG